MATQYNDTDIADKVIEQGIAVPDGLENAVLGQLFVKYRAAICGFLTRACKGDIETANDLTADSFVKAAGYMHRMESTNNYRAWLYTVATSVLINWQRKQKRRQLNLNMPDYGDSIADKAPRGKSTLEETTGMTPINAHELIKDPADEAVERDYADALRNILSDTPPEFIDVLLLRDTQALSYKEIAEETGVPLGTVRSRIFRARRSAKKSAELKAYLVS